jgi:uncharacterized protein YuzE
MRVRVDRDADAVYLNLTDRVIKNSEEIADGIVVDYDAKGRIVGVEILDASKRTNDPAALRQFSYDVGARERERSKPQKTSVSSSTMTHVRYDNVMRTLEVTFVGGKTYQYFGVPSAVYAKLLEAPSKGRFFNSRVRDSYMFQEVTARKQGGFRRRSAQ